MMLFDFFMVLRGQATETFLICYEPCHGKTQVVISYEI